MGIYFGNPHRLRRADAFGSGHAQLWYNGGVNDRRIFRFNPAMSFLA